MKSYGQFCPVAKSAEILGDPWSLLIVRELLLGSTRFSDLQRGLSRISPTVLNARLKTLDEQGVIAKRRAGGRRGHEYRLTPAGRELSGVLEALAVWGMRWALDDLRSNDLDVSFLMFDIQRRIDVKALPDGETVLCFQFPDMQKFKTWWIVCDDGAVDLCYDDPGKDVHLYITSSARHLIEVWMGDRPLVKAMQSGCVQLSGEAALCRTFPRWFSLAIYAGTPRPTAAERRG